jgi:hypothetical protein
MFGVTLFGIFLTPVFYYAIMRRTGKSRPLSVASSPTPEGDGGPAPGLAVPGQDGRSELVKEAGRAAP